MFPKEVVPGYLLRISGFINRSLLSCLFFFFLTGINPGKPLWLWLLHGDEWCNCSEEKHGKYPININFPYPHTGFGNLYPGIWDMGNIKLVPERPDLGFYIKYGFLELPLLNPKGEAE